MCAAHMVTYDVCGFMCSGEKPHPTSSGQVQGAEEAPGSLTQSQVRGRGWQQDCLSYSPRAWVSPFQSAGNRPCWLERNPFLKGIRRDLCLGPLGWPPRKVLGPDCRWDGIISELRVTAGSSLLNRQAAVGDLHMATHKTQVEHVKERAGEEQKENIFPKSCPPP